MLKFLEFFEFSGENSWNLQEFWPNSEKFEWFGPSPIEPFNSGARCAAGASPRRRSGPSTTTGTAARWRSCCRRRTDPSGRASSRRRRRRRPRSKAANDLMKEEPRPPPPPPFRGGSGGGGDSGVSVGADWISRKGSQSRSTFWCGWMLLESINCWMIHILQDSFRLFFRFCLKVFRPRARKKEKTDWSICGILQTRLMRVRISQISFKFHVALLTKSKLFHETQHGARTYPIDLSDVSKLRSRHSRLDMLWITAGSKLQGRSRRKTGRFGK